MRKLRAHLGPPATNASEPRRAPRLEVYVSSHCLNCGEAVHLAHEAAIRYPGVVVQVIDVDLDTTPPPERVVAVPTYLMDGRVISLGNQYPEELFARLHEAVG